MFCDEGADLTVPISAVCGLVLAQVLAFVLMLLTDVPQDVSEWPSAVEIGANAAGRHGVLGGVDDARV
jgi:hypothetical protein